MVTYKIRQLEATRGKLARLEKSVAVSLQKELAALPAAYGFDSVRRFFRAVKLASSGRPDHKTAIVKRRKRSVITDTTRGKVKKLAKSGKTGAGDCERSRYFATQRP